MGGDHDTSDDQSIDPFHGGRRLSVLHGLQRCKMAVLDSISGWGRSCNANDTVKFLSKDLDGLHIVAYLVEKSMDDRTGDEGVSDGYIKVWIKEMRRWPDNTKVRVREAARRLHAGLCGGARMQDWSGI